METIRSEVDSVVSDTEGIYISVNLLVEDRTDTTKLEVIARSRADRPCNVSYKKAGMVTWQAMEACVRVCASDCLFEGKEYRSILAIPVLYDEMSIGVISIDSSRPFDFYDRDDEIAAKIGVYREMAALVLKRGVV